MKKKKQKRLKNCPNCGAPADGSGRCPYCGTVYEECMRFLYTPAEEPEARLYADNVLIYESPRIPPKITRW